ncbi:MAG: nitrogen regulation protein [Gammaproteobacteria bacterium CG_4_10_14_0_8_um_filter_38_16]|nr:MAG: nitrogen regulation protein [Gammaproteobacteria bacterium CG_4_10_14_0_8_um_filter_38_16]PJA03388.1 MAG: nitrogen regulation protein [Gammaproteobacteria bacterium CG_4_10_14_0_2_um_filter_38_22]PJB11124.1 MAG: nitrogen regulation protein [Gammaproteobacteria bacterium CG_4_9_14_3_um_filter_38_9]
MTNSFIKPLLIGKKTFASNLIQAPLAGISCAPFRELVWQFGGVAYCCTEMLSAHSIANENDRGPRFQTRSPIEKNLCWQLSGNKPGILARASAHAIQHHADILDLNCGCPQPKIRKKGCGSKLLSDEKKLSELIKAMRQDDHTPVTLKMRIDANHGEFCDRSVAKMLENTGVDAIIVHGRHWTHDYNVPCQLDAIAAIVDAVSIPVIGNGDISDAEKIKTVFTQTHCAGFMIGRASVGQPWIYQKITDEINGASFSTPTSQHIGELFLQHARGLVQLEGEKAAILQCRRFGKYYASHLEKKAAFLEALYHIDLFSDFESNVKAYFN